MSLHDISKDHAERLEPKPNHNDINKAPRAHGTTQNHNAGEEATADGLKFKERQILANQDGNVKAAFGFFGTANKFGLKVAKAGYDADTAADTQLIFNSEQNTFKIVATGTITVAGTGGATTTNWSSISHGLPFAPIAVGFLNHANVAGVTTSGNLMLPTWTGLTVDTIKTTATNSGIARPILIFDSYLEIVPDATQVHVILHNATGSAISTLTVTYYLLQESAA
jgi:hypothetical protein